MNTGNITMDDFFKCIKELKNSKDSGLDNIPNEVWKTGTLSQQPLDVCNKTFNGEKPEIWIRSGIVPLL